MNTLPRAAVYVRVSSDLQEDNYSLPTQESACRKYCAEHGYQVVGVFSDVHTGAQYRERPGLTQLRELVRQKALDVVVCYAVDRLSRNQAHLYIIVEELAEHGCRLEFVTEKFEDTAVGRFILAAKSFAAEIEREKIRERVVRGRKARAESGKLLGTAPMPLYGYQWADPDHSRYVPDPITAPVVQRIFKMALDGCGVVTIANALGRSGIPSPKGKPHWSLTTVWRILTNPAYTGKGAAFVWKAKGRSYNREWDKAIPLPDGVVPPLIDEATFHAVQARLRFNREKSARNNRSPYQYLLRGGFARCAICGQSLVTAKQRGRPEYECLYHRPHPPGQPHPTIGARILDEIVWNAVRLAMQRDDLLEQGLRSLRDGDADDVADTAALDRAIAKLKRQQANLARAIAVAEEDTAVEALTAELERVSTTVREMERERAHLLEARQAQQRLRDRLSGLAQWRKHVAAKLDQMSYEERRWLLQLLGVVVRVWPASDDSPPYKRVKITMALPLEGLGESEIDLQTMFAR